MRINTLRNFRELKVWNKTRLLIKDIYLLTKESPEEEKFGLISLMRRASVSKPSNTTEGTGRRTDKELGRRLDTAIGSAYKPGTQVILCLDPGYNSEETFNEPEDKILEIERMIDSLREKLTN